MKSRSIYLVVFVFFFIYNYLKYSLWLYSKVLCPDYINLPYRFDKDILGSIFLSYIYT